MKSDQKSNRKSSQKSNNNISNATAKQRDPALDGIRGIAILIVMIGHCIVLNGLDRQDPYIYDAIRSVQMPLFMFISGIVAARSALKPEKLRYRAVSYLLPFFSWFIISYFGARIKDAVKGLDITISPADFVKELKELLFQTDKGLWFLSTLFVVTLVMTVSVWLSGKLSEKIIGKDFVYADIFITDIFAAVFYMFFILQGRYLPSFLSPGLTVEYMPFYVLAYTGEALILREGIIREKCSQKSFKPAVITGVVISSVVFLFMIIAFDLTAPADSMGVFALQEAASLAGTLSVYGICSLIFEKKKDIRLLPFIGCYTLEIYVLHFRFARLTGIEGRDLTLYSFKGILWTALTFIIMSVLTTACIFILKKIPLCDLILFGRSKRRKVLR